MANDPWFKDGLRFECTRCGNCCGGGPGMVRVTDGEIAALAKRLGVSEAEFRERYTRLFRRDIVILQEKPNFDCVFYDSANGWTVYEARSTQCRAWPFWNVITLSPKTWAEAANDCPGMNKGQLHSVKFITDTSRDDGTCSSILTQKAVVERDSHGTSMTSTTGT